MALEESNDHVKQFPSYGICGSIQHHYLRTEIENREIKAIILS